MSEETITEGQRKHLFALLGEAGIKNREDRLSFAREVLEIEENDLTSFTQLYVNEADDLIFAARAWKIVQSLRDLNGEMLKESISKVRRYYNYSRDEDVARITQDDAEEPTECSESDNQDQDEQKPVRRPRRSGKAPAKKSEQTKKSARSKQEINEKSRTHSGRSSKTRSGSFSSEEIGYDLD